MRLITPMNLLLATLMVGSTVIAATTEKSVEKEVTKSAISSEKEKSKKKTTDVSFEDVLVQGKYHFSDEAVTTVEQDKVLDALLSVRKDFRDRIQKSSERH